MKDYLEIAQSFLDSDRSVPDELLRSMNFSEQQKLLKMIEMKKSLKGEVDRLVPEKSLRLASFPNPTEKKWTHFRYLYAAVLFSVIMTLPVGRYIQSERLIREETTAFVDQLFLGDDLFAISLDQGQNDEWYGFNELIDY